MKRLLPGITPVFRSENDLFQRVTQLSLGILQLFFGVTQLFPGILLLFFGIIQLFLEILLLFLGVTQLFLEILQLFPGIVQLLFEIVQLFFRGKSENGTSIKYRKVMLLSLKSTIFTLFCGIG
jgi:hypothetical protein